MVEGMIEQLRYKVNNEKTSSIIEALKKGYTPKEIKNMNLRMGLEHPRLQVYDV